MSHKSEIKIQVILDDNRIPKQLFWQSDEDNSQVEAKAFLLSVLEKDTLDTLKLDLWTTSFQVNEMDKLMFNTLNSLADTYFKATNNQALATQMRQFAQFFGEETEILKPAE